MKSRLFTRISNTNFRENKSGSFQYITGFTLVEILVALFVFSIVVTLVFSSFRQVALSARMVDETGDDYEMLHGCLMRMTADLESVHINQRPGYLEPEFNDDPDKFRFTGETQTVGDGTFPIVRFTSAAHIGVNRDTSEGIAEIIYYVDETEEDGRVIRRSDRIAFEAEFEKSALHPILCRNVKRFTVGYYDEEGESHESWDSESELTGFATPTRILLTVETGNEEKSVVMGTGVLLPGVREQKEER